MSGVDLVQWLREQLDADALWAMEASRRHGGPAPEGGVHWQWEDSDTDEIVIPDPGREEHVGGESFRVALRSRETWPTYSVGELPQFAIPEAEEVPSAVGGHIVRWDPARVLREIDGRRRTLIRCGEAMLSASPMLVHFAKQTVREMALSYQRAPGYAEALASFE